MACVSSAWWLLVPFPGGRPWWPMKMGAGSGVVSLNKLVVGADHAGMGASFSFPGHRGGGREEEDDSTFCQPRSTPLGPLKLKMWPDPHHPLPIWSVSASPSYICTKLWRRLWLAADLGYLAVVSAGRRAAVVQFLLAVCHMGGSPTSSERPLRRCAVVERQPWRTKWFVPGATMANLLESSLRTRLLSTFLLEGSPCKIPEWICIFFHLLVLDVICPLDRKSVV